MTATETTPKRVHCSACGYPEKTCVCSAVVPLTTRVQIDILQHPSETHAAKNTVRLCQLCLSDLKVWVGEQPEDFNAVREQLAEDPRSIVVLYPSQTSTPLSEFVTPVNDAQVRLVLIDGTWKKAYKIWQCNPWLQNYPTSRLAPVESQYSIRKAPKSGYLSTLEAVAHSLNLLQPSLDVTPLFDVLAAMQRPFKEHSTERNQRGNNDKHDH